MRIKGFIENSLNEWEGQIASVVFLPRCNLRCPYCHAGALVTDPAALETVPERRVTSYLRQQRGWLDGVAVTGGEPTLHGDRLVAFIRRLKRLPTRVMLETNGTRPALLGRLIEEGLLDAVSMDVKAPLTAGDYRRVTRREVDPEKVRTSIRRIIDSGLPHEFRVTLVPGLVGEDELRRIAPDLEGARKVALQNFKPDHCLDEGLRGRTPYMPPEMDGFGRILEPFVARCVLRGRGRGLAARGAA